MLSKLGQEIDPASPRQDMVKHKASLFREWSGPKQRLGRQVRSDRPSLQLKGETERMEEIGVIFNDYDCRAGARRDASISHDKAFSI